jgi:hypothetical protein
MLPVRRPPFELLARLRLRDDSHPVLADLREVSS